MNAISVERDRDEKLYEMLVYDITEPVTNWPRDRFRHWMLHQIKKGMSARLCRCEAWQQSYCPRATPNAHSWRFAARHQRQYGVQ